jgi:hypothetical protein
VATLHILLALLGKLFMIFSFAIKVLIGMSRDIMAKMGIAESFPD